MATPPIPQKPYGYPTPHRQGTLPPPVPPVPPDLRVKQARYDTPSPYELPDTPLPAPRPFRVDPSIATTIAHNFPHNFQEPGPVLADNSEWSAWVPSITSQVPLNPPNHPNPHPQHRPSAAPSPPRSSTAPPSLTAPLPIIANLQGAVNAVQNPSHDPFLKIAWCRDVFLLVERSQPNPSPTTDPPVGPVTITDPVLHHLAHTAVPIILQLANTTQSPLPIYAAEAIYWRAMFAASGAYSEFIKHNPRVAFRDFETAARGGYATAWFRLGRDYENFNDTQHARECFERGVKLGVESCAYRMGMAHLLGQLGLPANPQLAIPLLSRAATLATTLVPQPAYVYALLLLNEFSQSSIPPAVFGPFIPPASSPPLEARKHLERAAYLHFAPAQYKLGHAYEHAQPPFPFDALLSVQYYSLASQQGEVEADMALSKWFLCGSGDADANTSSGFEKDEVLALTFAEKAANKGLPSAEFAMGYYAEVGVGRPKDVQTAIRWYTKAKDHGNTDAAERLVALSQPSPQALSRTEHDHITENKLVRKRTQAKQRSDARPLNNPQIGQLGSGNIPGTPIRDGGAVVGAIRRQSMKVGGGSYYGTSGPPGSTPQTRPGGVSSPRPRPQQPPAVQQPQPQQPNSQGPLRPVYSLSDIPSTPPTLPTPGPGGPPSRPPNVRPTRVGLNENNSPAATAKPQKTGPATFAEMGIQGAKASDDGCIIM